MGNGWVAEAYLGWGGAMAPALGLPNPKISTENVVKALKFRKFTYFLPNIDYIYNKKKKL